MILLHSLLFLVEWSKEDLEKLRLCRNRAYYKVNSKRRQHLQASLSTYLQKEWLSHYPDTGLSAKALLKAYQDNFEPDKPASNTNGSPRGGFRGGPRRGRGGRGGGRGGRSVASVPEVKVEPKDPSIEDHADKQWTETMMSNLMQCNQLVNDRIQDLGNAGKTDFAAMLHEEWVKIYPHSTLSVRSIKSRLTVYLKTMGHDQQQPLQPPPTKRRKIETPSSQEISVDKDENKAKLEAMLDLVKKENPEASQEDLLFLLHQEWIKNESSIVSLTDIRNTVMSSSKKVEEQPPERFSICDQGHWVHLFSDKDVNVECILTEQLLQIRNSFKDTFQGCDIFKPRKPKGLASMVLDQWKEHYPNSEETNKTIGFKLAKYDRGPDNAEKIKVSPSGRISWTPQMLQKLQETRLIAQDLVAKSQGLSLTKAWQDEWKKYYPDMTIDWRSILSRYNYHFGNLDTISSTNKVSTPNSEPSPEESKDSDKVKGFRNWTAVMEADLVETNEMIVKDHPELEKGSSEFNRLLLKEFQKLHPKCMESARSLNSKLQSIEKEGKITEDLRRQSLDNNQENQEVEIKVESSAEMEEQAPLEPLKENVKIQEAEFPPSKIEGFEDWNLPMIRDFIGCMDAARKKFTILKEQEPETKLVPLLLEEWNQQYPQTTETVKTILVKIKHLKTHKESIKKELNVCGLLPKMEEAAAAAEVKPAEVKTEDPTEEFKWSREMIPDVIESRRIAEKIKAEQLALGKKVSAHHLWAEEFKKIHPTSNFTSNNLSVHLWTWKKQQQKNSKKSNGGKSSNAEPLVTPVVSSKKPMTTSNGTFKDVQARDELLEIGRKVEQMLQNPQTPNELKLQGFANVLHEEWTKAHPGSTETSRSLNMMYSRLIRQDADQVETIFATWTPKHHGVLKHCMEDYPRKETEFETEYMYRIIKSWRSKFPKSSVSDESLLRRIHDLIYNKDSEEFEPKKSSGAAKKSLRSEDDLDSQRRPNNRGQMNWNKVAINDLLQCHNSASNEHKLLLSNGQKPDKLSELVHRKFLTLHPYCKLTPAILMTKCYSWKSAIEKGTLDFILPKIELKSEDSKPGLKVKRSSSKDLIFRTWTQEMINDMLKTRKIALNRKRKVEESFGKEANLTDLWYEEFLKLHPDYKSSKKNLWRKYKWYKSRVSNSLEDQPMDIEENVQPVQQPILRMKNIRKDVFSYLKAVLEEARIFLPMKLPEELPPAVTSNPVVTETTFTASQTLASFQHQAIMSLEPVPVEPMEILTTTSQPPIEILTAQPPMEILEPVTSPPPQQPLENQEQEQVSSTDPSIKLPGGATLVAVTDRNADALLKPKQLEKPHVTITIGDRPVEQQQAMMTAIMQTPTAQIPLNIPFPQQPATIALPTVPVTVPTTLNLVQPPPLPQLKPFKPVESLLPLRIKARLDELMMNETNFQDLLKIYESVREEYIELLKRGFLIFFPYLLGTRWREKFPNSSLTGRKLTTLIGKRVLNSLKFSHPKLLLFSDMYVEEKRRGRITSPEYLTKVPCGFEVTELVLKQILVCYAETKRSFSSEELLDLDLDQQSQIYSQMIARWQKIHPEIKLTPKQIISIHHMLNFEPGKDEPSPEIVCYLTESLRKMDKEVPEKKFQETSEMMDELSDDEETVDYDETNLSMEQLQELFLATQRLEKSGDLKRPRKVTKKLKLFWTDDRVADLFLAAEIGWQKFKMNKKISLGKHLCKAWYALNPGSSQVSPIQILSRYKYQIRQDKRRATLESDKVIKAWERNCEAYRISEENIQVIDETIKEVKPDSSIDDSVPLKLEYNSDLNSRDYNRYVFFKIKYICIFFFESTHFRVVFFSGTKMY